MHYNLISESIDHLNIKQGLENHFHLWGGTLFKIEWMNNTFENHTGAHFILVRNLDNTYTLTMANGNTREPDTCILQNKTINIPLIMSSSSSNDTIAGLFGSCL
ncbi:MAG: hypothetical protein HXS44_14190 [Theionarchaea archaeon]|nr:hypothetical protein [Theionarchaea archaeon]